MNAIVIVCDTLRRDHCSAYTGGVPLNQAWSREAPDWAVPTPNMQRLADRGTTFENAWCGSTPCMPARRDIYTGRYEFLERGWGPLEDTDADLPRAVSGGPNRSIQRMREEGLPVSQLVTDHFHLWEQGSGNYHMGYTGFEFIRGIESDAWLTDPVEFPCPPGDVMNKNERHFRNMHLTRREEKDWTCAKVFTRASDWLQRNHTHDNFYLHIDCFPPHEPLDPPEELVKPFWPSGYSDPQDTLKNWPYSTWPGKMSERAMNFARARYAGNVSLVDRWLGRLIDTMDELDLWRNTVLIFTTDHGTFNGDRGRIGKLQTHQHDPVAHIPFIVCHPQAGHGERREQLVQLVDIYPTVLSAVGRPIPEGRHGVNLLPAVADAKAHTRDYAIAGMFGGSATITDGRWILHQQADASKPLNWYGHQVPKFIGYPLEPFTEGRRPVKEGFAIALNQPTWLSDKAADVNELTNLLESHGDKAQALRGALRSELSRLGAPAELATRFGVA